MFKVNNKDTRTTPLPFRIFNSISKICASGKVRDVVKKVTKSKICSKGFNLTKKWLHSSEISNQSSMFIFFFFLHIKFPCSGDITARNSKTKCYKKLHLSRCSGGLSTGIASIFMEEVLNLILWTFHITMNCNILYISKQFEVINE